jgi:hypothetical protein
MYDAQGFSSEEPVETTDKFSLLGASVVSLRFFAAGYQSSDGKRDFRTGFRPRNDQAIWWQLDLKYPKASSPQNFKLVATLHGPRNAPLLERTGVYLESAECSVQPGWTNSYCSYHWSSEQLVSGTYNVSILAWGKEIARGSFEIQ